MPDLTYTTPVLTNPADKSEIEGNLGDIQTLVNGGLDNDNFHATAGIGTAKLAARDYEFLVHLQVQPEVAQPGTSSTVPLCVVGLPGDLADGVSYRALSANYYIIDDGTAGAVKFKVEYGYAAANVWVPVGGDIISTVAKASGGANGEQSGDLTINTTGMTTDDTHRYFLALFLEAPLDVTALTNAYSGLFVTLKLRRTDGLRGT